MFEFQTVDVQPNDGFGTLLPLESFDVDIMFNAKKAKVNILNTEKVGDRSKSH